MMTGEGQDKRSLDVLPKRIGDAHRALRNTVDTLCVLEDFLLGVQVREAAPKVDREAPSGVVDKCFDNLTGISNTIEQCHDQLRHIIEKVGATPKDSPTRL